MHVIIFIIKRNIAIKNIQKKKNKHNTKHIKYDIKTNKKTTKMLENTINKHPLLFFPQETPLKNTILKPP